MSSIKTSVLPFKSLTQMDRFIRQEFPPDRYHGNFEPSIHSTELRGYPQTFVSNADMPRLLCNLDHVFGDLQQLAEQSINLEVELLHLCTGLHDVGLRRSFHIEIDPTQHTR